MKIYLCLVTTLAAAFLGGIFYIELEARSDRIAAKALAIEVENRDLMRQVMAARHAGLRNIVDDWERQYKFTHGDYVRDEIVSTNDAEMLWGEYELAFKLAKSLLQLTNIDDPDFKPEMPSTKYIDDEFKLGILERR